MSTDITTQQRQDKERLREIAKWLLSDAQDVDDVWDEFDVAACDLHNIANRE